ncbi:sulfate transporter [Mycobacterium sp. NPDC048908]|uniref:sulfate transporter n=1 Tax=Mycobacterium sp. NPDC048908 TaxID=3364292 RepID=UPI0037123F25
MAGNMVLTPHGLLDSITYRLMRDSIIKAALDEPAAVIVDVSDLCVPAESAWVVFTSARWHVGIWPEVPIILVNGDRRGRSAITRNGVTRYVPLYPTIQAALEAVADAAAPVRYRARAALQADSGSLSRGRELVTEWLTSWAQPELIPVAKIVVTTLIENVLRHTHCSPGVRLEYDGSTITVAVEDTCHAPAVLREAPRLNDMPAGLRIVAALCRAWGNAPTPSGKTVWAVIGPENRL